MRIFGVNFETESQKRLKSFEKSMSDLSFENKSLKEDLLEMADVASEARAMASSLPFLSDQSIVLPQYRYEPYNGEKNDGELGPITNLLMDYYGLAQRAWKYYAQSDIAKIVIQRYVDWVIDVGLNLKSNPLRKVLESEGIFMDPVASEKFNDLVEARFGAWQQSKESSFSGEKNMKQLAQEIMLNSLISDCLVVLRYVNNTLKVQLIDGRKVSAPGIQDLPLGHTVSNGVQLDADGRHVAYWVRNKLGEAKPIPAYSKTGLRVAFLVKSDGWTLDFHRGLPKISVVMESIGKLDRYKEATVANAEEIAKFAMQITHEVNSDGENPFSANGVVARLKRTGANTVPIDDSGEQLAKKVYATFNKSAVNMTQGSEIKPIQPSNIIKEFDNFYSTNANIVCAAVGIPPNIAFMLYTDSFSASRAATKDWDHTIDLRRDNFNDGCMSYIYKFWLFTEIMSGKIDAPGYVSAYKSGNFMITDSYSNSRFTGPHFPHVDPVKEVTAERMKLGPLGANFNLTTAEQATENLGGGDSDSNMEQFSDEVKKFEQLGLSAQPETENNE